MFDFKAKDKKIITLGTAINIAITANSICTAEVSLTSIAWAIIPGT